MARKKTVRVEAVFPENHKELVKNQKPPRTGGNEFVSLAEKIAQDSTVLINWKFKDAAEYYPNHPTMRTVRKYYMYAKGGPLLVDEPRDPKDVFMCFEKQKLLKKLGYRHIVVERDSTIGDLLEQLGEL